MYRSVRPVAPNIYQSCIDPSDQWHPNIYQSCIDPSDQWHPNIYQSCIDPSDQWHPNIYQSCIDPSDQWHPNIYQSCIDPSDQWHPNIYQSCRFVNRLVRQSSFICYHSDVWHSTKLIESWLFFSNIYKRFVRWKYDVFLFAVTT